MGFVSLLPFSFGLLLYADESITRKFIKFLSLSFYFLLKLTSVKNLDRLLEPQTIKQLLYLDK
jgi:hypothetical protein